MSKNNNYSTVGTTDSILNNISGLGTSKDKSSHNSFYTRRLSDFENIEVYRGSWVAARVVDVPVFESLREWRTFTFPDEDNIADELYKAESKYKLRDSLKKVLTYANIFGGGAILLNVEGSGDISTPLTLDNIKQNSLRWLTALDKRRIYPLVSPDIFYPNSPNFMTPEYYTTTLDPKDKNNSFKIHKSRLVLFNGIDLPLDEMAQNQFWGDSVYTRIFDAISNADITQQAVSSLVHKSNIDIWKIKDLQGNLEKKDGDSHITKRISCNNQLLSIVNSLVIDKDNEEIERNSLNFAGLDKVLQDFLNIVASASGIPVTKLLGSHVPGLNSSGESDIRNFYDTIKSYQNDIIRARLETLDKVIAKSTLGYLPDDLSFDFNPLWQPSDKEIAEIQVIKSQRDLNYLNAGVISPANVAQELLVEKTYQSLSEEDVKDLDDLGVVRAFNNLGLGENDQPDET